MSTNETHYQHPSSNDENEHDTDVEERIVIEEQLVEHEEDAQHYRLHGPRDHFNPHHQRQKQRQKQQGGTVIRGNPIFLIEKIIRNRIFESAYFKQHCFGLTAETLIERAIELGSTGGCYGGNRKPTPFLCLLLRMLYIEVGHDIVLEYVQNEHYKYVTALGALYLRMTADAAEVYRVLEPLYNDYRKLRFHNVEGKYEIIHMDEFVETLLTEESCCGIKMPLLLNRRILEDRGLLDGPRKTYFDEYDEEDLEEMLQELKQSESTSTAETNVAAVNETEMERETPREVDSSIQRETDRHSRSRSPSPERDTARSHRLRFKSSKSSKQHYNNNNINNDNRGDDYNDSGDDYNDSGDNGGEGERRNHKRNERSWRGNERPAKSTKSGGDAELSIEETNKLRKQLGLAPLKM